MSLLLVVTVCILTPTACRTATDKTSEDNKSNPKQSDDSKESNARIDDLIEAWSASGIKAEVKEKSSSSTLNSMYGCINQYTVLMDEEQFMLLEYDLENLNNTGERYLKFVDDNGYDSKTNEPAWHNQEFLLMNKGSVLENGKVVDEYFITKHPKSEKILEVFKSFK